MIFITDIIEDGECFGEKIEKMRVKVNLGVCMIEMIKL